MKIRLFFIVGTLSLASAVRAQEPVSWTYSAKQIANQLYEIHITAIIDDGWHIYAMKQPEGAISVPTSFTYANNPLVALLGEPKVEGRLIHHKDETGIPQDQYSRKADFIQVVRLKATIKTSLKGTLTFQACMDEGQCLTAENKTFSVSLPPERAAK